MKKLIALLIILAAGLVIVYIYMPVVSYGFWGFPIMLAFFAVMWIILNLPANANIQQSQQFIKRRQKWILIPTVLVLVLIAYAIIVPVVTSWALLRSSDYRNRYSLHDESLKFVIKLRNGHSNKTTTNKLQLPLTLYILQHTLIPSPFQPLSNVRRICVAFNNAIAQFEI